MDTMGRIFFVQERLGKAGELIFVWKFRTMYENASTDLSEILNEKELDGTGHIIDDPRRTPFGMFLSYSKIDELPQFYNLFKGDITIVGIRPRTREEWTLFPQAHKDRALKYKPGLLGVQYARANVRSFEEMICDEAKYLDRKEISPLRTDAEYAARIVYTLGFKAASTVINGLYGLIVQYVKNSPH